MSLAYIRTVPYLCHMATISIRKYAVLKGCTEGNVRLAIKYGKIIEGVARKPDGKVAGIIVEVADREWADNYNMDRIRNHAVMGNLKSGSPVVEFVKEFESPVVEKKPAVKKEKGKPLGKAAPPVDDQEPETDGTEDNTTIQEAKRKEAIYKAKLLEIELKEKQGSVVKVEQIRKSLFDAGAQIRASIMTVPDRDIDNIWGAETRNEAYQLLVGALNQSLEKLHSLKVKGLNG